MKFGNIVVFGDSYSTFPGVVPEGFHVYYTGKRGKEPDLQDASQLWWHRLMTETDSKVIHNNSFSGSTICYLGRDQEDCSETSSFVARFEKLVREGYFKNNQVDTVMILGGTNDSWIDDPIGTVQYENFEKQDLYSVLPAVCFLIKRIREEIPNARIVQIINSVLKPEISAGMKAAAAHYGTDCVELHGVEMIAYHPTIRGMEQIKDQILEQLK